jgi:hypothetical protein
MNHTQIAEIILSQLGGYQFRVMTGFTNVLAHSPDETKNTLGGLSFKLSGKMTKDGINYVKISLNADDLYVMEFGRIHGSTYKVKQLFENVYVEDMKRIFEDTTGLFTKLF